MCDVCSREPLYYGGRGEECEPCSEAGDVGTTIGVAIGGFVMALVAVGAVGWYLKRRGITLSTSAKNFVAGLEGREDISADARNVLASRQGGTDRQKRQQGSKGSPAKKTRMARLKELVGRLGVKSRILISLAQVMGQMSTTYDIQYPDFYSQMLAEVEKISPNVKFLPFGCTFPKLDNYMFDLVVQTAVPLGTSHRTCRRSHILRAPLCRLWIMRALCLRAE
jgi:hypothetical protein|eukprot:5250305-Prymnesium_polylepis.2